MGGITPQLALAQNMQKARKERRETEEKECIREGFTQY